MVGVWEEGGGGIFDIINGNYSKKLRGTERNQVTSKIQSDNQRRQWYEMMYTGCVRSWRSRR